MNIYRRRPKSWNFPRRLGNFFCLEQAVIVRLQGASEDKKFAAKPKQGNSNLLAVFGICVVLSFLIFTSLSAQDDEQDLVPSSPSQLAFINSKPSYLINGLINPLSGHLCLRKTDLIAKGAQNIILTRLYIPPAMPFSCTHQSEYEKFSLYQYLSKHYKGWQFLPQRKLQYNPERKEVRLTTPYGATFDFDIAESKTTLIGPHFAISNLCGDEPDAKLDPRHIRIVSDEQKIFVHMPDGTVLHYEGSLLQKEVLPNGKVLRYTYDEQEQPLSVQSLDPKERFVYASLSISGSPKEGHCHFASSSGQTVDYRYQMRSSHIEMKEKIGDATHTEAWDVLYPPLLTEVRSPFCQSETIDYCDRFLVCHHLIQPISEIKTHLPLPGKQDGWTDVQHSDGTKTVYYFSKDFLLTAIQSFNGDLLKEKINTWTDNHWLKSQEIRDGEKKTLLKKTYDYDSYGNPVLEILTGDLTGQGIQENFAIRREFSQDGRHLLLKEKFENGKTVYYSYLPGTNLITAKLTQEHDHILIREFFDYDESHNLIQTISDNGSATNPHDLTNVTQRKMTHYALRQSPPFLHMPEWIEETYVENGSEKVLQKKHLVYDIYGNVASEEIYDAHSEWAYTLTKEYDKQGNLVSETNSLGQKAFFKYDARQNCIQETNFSGRLQTNRQFDQKGRLVEEKVTGDCGTCHKILFEYDAFDRLIQKTNTFGHSVRYGYDPLVSKVNKTEFPDNSTTHSTFDPFGREVSHTDAFGNTKHYHYNAYGSITEITYPDGQKEHFLYSKAGELVSHTHQNGLTVNYSLDVLGRILSKTYVFDHKPLAQESFRFDGFNMISKTDREGHETHYTYDGSGRKIRENHSGHITDSTYDALGRVSTLCQHNGDNTLYTHFKRDFEGRVLEERRSDISGKCLSLISFTYDDDGNKATTTRYINGKPSQHLSVYDAFGRLIESKDPFSHTTKCVYNENHTNSLGQKVLQIQTIDPHKVITLETRDVLDRTVKKEVLNGKKVILSCSEQAYDPHGNVTTQKNHVYREGQFQNTQEITKTYTANHQLQTLTEGNSKTTFSYASCGKIGTKTLPSGITLNYTYDPFGNVSGIVSSDETIAHTFKYDALGNLKSAVDAKALPHVFQNIRTGGKEFIGKSANSITRQVDPFGNVTCELFSTGCAIVKEYDNFNRLTRIKIPHLGEISYTYDPLFLRKVTRFSDNGQEIYTHLYENYDLDGHLLSEQLIGHIGQILHKIDARGQKTKISTPYFSENCSYDAVGNLIKRHNHQFEHRYQYDDVSQIISESNPHRTYMYDSLYNRIPINESSYDLFGNQISKDKFSLSYDPLNRLIEAESASQKIIFSYDPLGRRLSKTIHVMNSTGVEEKKTEYYLYDGQNEIGAFQDKKLKNFRVLGLNTIAVELDGHIYAPIIDVQKNIRKLIDFETRSPLESYDFTAFGDSLQECEFLNPWRFASKRFDQELGLIYFGKRDYDPEEGRWMTPDPEGFLESVNLYQYMFNNPLGF